MLGSVSRIVFPSPALTQVSPHSHITHTPLALCSWGVETGHYLFSKKRGREGEDTVQLWGVFPPFLLFHQAANRVTVSPPPPSSFSPPRPLVFAAQKANQACCRCTSMFPPRRCVTHKPSLCFSSSRSGFVTPISSSCRTIGGSRGASLLPRSFKKLLAARSSSEAGREIFFFVLFLAKGAPGEKGAFERSVTAFFFFPPLPLPSFSHFFSFPKFQVPRRLRGCFVYY